jgi:glycogen synthase
MVYSNAVTTVSPTYANEVLTGGQAGWLRSTLMRPEIKSKVGKLFLTSVIAVSYSQLK